MEIIKFDEVKKNWRQIAKHNLKDLPPNFEIEVYQKLLNVFQLGDFYYFIFNLSSVEVEFVNDNVKKVLGIEPVDFTPKYVYETIHPEDQARFVQNEQKVTSFFNQLQSDKILKYKVSYDYRMKTNEGKYKWIHQQIITLQCDENGAVIRTLGVHTDITHIKTNNVPAGLSIIGLDGEPSYFGTLEESNILIQQKEVYTEREKEIIKLIISGMKSEEIANKLFISIHTVSTHRKNILSKSSCVNWPEFVSKALSQGM